MITLVQRIQKYFEIDQQMKGLDKEKKPMNEEIKKEMKAGNFTKVESGECVATLSTQERTSINEDKLVLKLKSLGLTDLIKTVEKPDEEKLEAAIALGLLSATELESCIEKKYVDVLTVKAVKAKKGGK